MKNSMFLLLILVLISCNKQEKKVDDNQISKAQVRVVGMEIGHLPNNLKFSGNTIYLNKNSIVTPVNGYITEVYVNEGDRVTKGKILFKMQSPESYIMQQKDSLKKSYGELKIIAPVAGIISGLKMMQKGSYSEQATELCTIIASNDLKLEINLPFEYHKYAKVGQKCQVVLPDNSIIETKFSKILPQMDAQSQSMKILANLHTNIFIPENMIVKVLINQSDNKDRQILPKTCLMSDALMTEFWVMKLLNDSLALKVPVMIENQTHRQVEILSPVFKLQDRFISEGAYGLGDSALVEIIN